MGVWEDFRAREAPRIQALTQRELDRRAMSELQQRYAAWTVFATRKVLEDLALVFRERAREWASPVGAPLVGQPEQVQLGGSEFFALGVSWLGCSVQIYSQRPLHSPPAVHLLRQSGGHRAPRMACVPGAWLAKTPEGGYRLCRFDATESPVTLDELAVMALSLLVGGASPQPPIDS